MQLAKKHIDVGLYTNDTEAMLECWQTKVGLRFAQVLLAGTFVATRVLHAIINIGVNHAPARFGAYVTGCITLGVVWARLASTSL